MNLIQNIEDMVNNDLNESSIDTESRQIVLNIMRGLDDVKQGNFSDKTKVNTPLSVIPAKAGIHQRNHSAIVMDSRLRGNDDRVCGKHDE